MAQLVDQVHRRPKVAVLSTGDEVVEPSTDRLGPGQIRDANRSMLLAAAAGAGAEVMDLGIARDTEGDVEACFSRAVSEGADVLITSGSNLPTPFSLLPSIGLKESSDSPVKSAIRPCTTKIITYLAENSLAILDLDFTGIQASLPCSCSSTQLFLNAGGVSMGDKDFVKPILERRGVVHFGKVAPPH